MKTILLIILTGLFSFSVSGQGNKISDIREKVQFINTDTSYVKVTLENNDFLEEMTDGGGQLIGFFKGETISKITERIGLSYAKYSTEYYFWKGQLFFCWKLPLPCFLVHSEIIWTISRTITSSLKKYLIDQVSFKLHITCEIL